MIRFQFEAGSGKHFNDVNYLFGDNGKCRIYAEVECPVDASCDYGYLPLKRAITSVCKEIGIDDDMEFWYDDQEDLLEDDAQSYGKVFVEVDSDDVFIQTVIDKKCEGKCNDN